MKNFLSRLSFVILILCLGVMPCFAESAPEAGAWAAIPFDTESFRTAGNIVTFGAYEQDGNTGKDPIEWIVLDVQDDQALLLSLYGLDAHSYTDHYGSITWESCTLRAWLNRDFMYEAFSKGEREAILFSDVDNRAAQGNPEWETDGGNDTQDQVFLLSYHEAFKLYFTDEASRQCILTPYAIANEAFTSDNFRKNGQNTGSWWLRSPGSFNTLAANVYYDGTLDGIRADYRQGTVRPVIRLNLAAEIPDREAEAREASDLYQKALNKVKKGSRIEDVIDDIILAAEMGNAEAQCDLGWGYWHGQGLEQSYEKALWYYGLAARQGNGLAYYNLAVMHQKGYGVDPSIWEAIKLYNKSAECGFTEAYYTLGSIYASDGNGVSKSIPRAIEFWQAGADQGHGKCQYNLGLIYMEGMDVEKDYEKAVTYFRLALDHGVKEAAQALGICYENGYGVEKNPEKAKEYYQIWQGQ